jgi:hypothetical protein
MKISNLKSQISKVRICEFYDLFSEIWDLRSEIAPEVLL